MHFKLILILASCALVQSKLVNLSCNQIRAFVDGHNSRRLQLAQGKVEGQPAASNMKFMVWDSELAAKAAKWATRNELAHNPDKTIGSGRFRTGENICWTASTDSNSKININSCLDAWFDEYKHFTYGPITSSQFDGSSKHQIGHYTQMAWADTTYIGCGISEYWKDNMKNFLVVCNYGPPGNYLGQTPYKTSEGTSNSLQCSIGDCSRPYDKC
ncbi:venom allergen 5-like [Battus philenor]|uniref:venom allergen 5-like n=1 Tax=Battus philenor TaxID=42288 RepID=UPI0035D0CA8E